MNYVKYPRTYHLPFSPGANISDKVHKDISFFEGMNVVITEKMDGENTTMYRDYIHARSIDSKNHPSRNYVKALHGQICYTIPDGWRVCGENLYAKHSIYYDNLESYFQVFSIIDFDNITLSWDETIEICKIIGLKTVREIYRGVFDINFIKNYSLAENQEGYVIRNADNFSFENYKFNTAKFVRNNHIQTDEHWMSRPVIPNKLRKQ